MSCLCSLPDSGTLDATSSVPNFSMSCQSWRESYAETAMHLAHLLLAHLSLQLNEHNHRRVQQHHGVSSQRCSWLSMCPPHHMPPERHRCVRSHAQSVPDRGQAAIQAQAPGLSTEAPHHTRPITNEDSTSSQLSQASNACPAASSTVQAPPSAPPQQYRPPPQPLSSSSATRCCRVLWLLLILGAKVHSRMWAASASAAARRRRASRPEQQQQQQEQQQPQSNAQEKE
jgi:hypothetical protein